MENTASKSLYDILVTHDFEPEILDVSGKPVTNPAEAEMFSFDWKTANHNYGTVVILLDTDNNLQVFFGDNIGRSMETGDKSDWYDFLHQLKSFATRNLMTFEINDLSRLKYTMQGMAAIKEGLFEGYYGKKNISYRDEPKQVRLMIKHNKNIPEGEARYRAIESLYVETADGERFKVPSRSLAHGRMLARHVAEGGNPYDAFGQHITQIVNEMNTLARFIRASRGKEYTGETADLVGNAVRHYQDLKAKAKRMIGQRGYGLERESFDPAAVSDTEITAEAVRNMFVEQSLDQRIEEALPILAKLASTEEENNMKEVNQFESWVNSVCEGTWALPDTPESMNKLKELMSKPLVVGADATNATEQLYDLVGDDELFDRLGELADSDPNANCWEDEGVINRLGELGIDITPTVNDMAQDAEQNDTKDVAEGYYDLNDEGMQPIDLSTNPSFKQLVNRYTQLFYQGHEGTYDDDEAAESDAIEQYVANRFGQKGSDHLLKAAQSSYGGRDDGRGMGSSRSSNLGQPSQPGGDFRTTKSGKMHGQDVKMMKNKVADRLGRHPEPMLPEQDVEEGILDTVKKVGGKVLDKLGHGSDEDLINKLRKDAGLPPRMTVPNKKSDQKVGEDLDTDGVMMTKPSNMSS